MQVASAIDGNNDAALCEAISLAKREKTWVSDDSAEDLTNRCHHMMIVSKDAHDHTPQNVVRQGYQ